MTMTLTPPPSWVEDAACSPSTSWLFFAPDGKESNQRRVEREADARALCAGCPVASRCALYAAQNHIPEGIWGGIDAGALR